MEKIFNIITEKAKVYKKQLLIVFIISIITLVITFIFSIRNTIDYVTKIHSGDAIVVGIEKNKNNKINVYEIEFYDQKNYTIASTLKTPKKFKINDSFKVYYSSKDKIYLDRKNPIIILLYLINLGITVFLFIILKKLYTVDSNKKKILDDNLVIFAYIDKVTSKQDGNKTLYNITFTWFNNEDRKTYTFISEDLKKDPTMSINLSNKNGANIHLDRNNYDNYIIDLDELINNKI